MIQFLKDLKIPYVAGISLLTVYTVSTKKFINRQHYKLNTANNYTSCPMYPS